MMDSINSDRMVAVVTPFFKEGLSPDEEISLRHLRHFLGQYHRYLAAPEGLEVNYPGFKIKRFNKEFFRDIPSYSRLMLSSQFYRAFSEYKYILIYQLDCLVFSDQLRYWCEMDFDYIGAPWLKSEDNPEQGFSRVGNGGFSLRKAESFLKVLDSRRHSGFFSPLPDIRDLNPGQRLFKRLRVLREARRGIDWYISHYTLNEDHFWADRARLFYPDFKIAPVEAGLRFSFEFAPGYCFDKSNGQLPFGCHAWPKWDRNFWQPYLLK